MQPPSDRPWIIAHRGASAAERENTLAAFRVARDLGADAVEFDVRRTADGVLVVHHDPAVDGVGPLPTTPMRDLRSAAPWVPTLEEALAACDGMWVNAEIKNAPSEPGFDPDDEVLAAVVDAIPPGTLITSFNPTTVARSLREAGSHRTGLLVLEGVDPHAVLDMAAPYDTVHPAVEDVRNADLGAVVRGAGARRLQVVVWTVDDPDEVRALAAAGVAGIITNVPDVALAALD